MTMRSIALYNLPVSVSNAESCLAALLSACATFSGIFAGSSGWGFWMVVVVVVEVVVVVFSLSALSPPPSIMAAIGPEGPLGRSRIQELVSNPEQSGLQVKVPEVYPWEMQV